MSFERLQPASAASGRKNAVWTPIAIILALTGLIAGAPLLARADPEGVRIGEGYTRIVNEVLANPGGEDRDNWLRARNVSEAGEPIVELRPEIAEDLAPFVRASYLAQDLTEDDPTLWRINRNQVRGIDPNAHRVSGPYTTGRRWEGSVRFADRPNPAITLDPQGGDPDASAPVELVRGGANLAVKLNASGSDQTARAGAIEFRDARDRPVAALRLVQDNAVLVRRETDEGVVTVSGARITARDGPIVWVVNPGESIVIAAPGSPRREYRLSVHSQQISDWHHSGDRVRNASTRVFAGMAESVADQLSARNSHYVSQNMQTALRVDLQADLQRTLTEKSRTLRDQLRGAGSDDAERGRQPFRAAAVVMDGRTGEIVGMASYPSTPEDIDAHGPLSPAQTRLLERHHALDALPIGSVAKAPMAAAILRTRGYEGLHALRIRGDGQPFRTVLGIPLGGAINEEASCGGTYDFDCAIRKSSNKYAVTLLLLGSAGNPYVQDPSLQPVGHDAYGFDDAMSNARPPDTGWRPDYAHKSDARWGDFGQVPSFPWVETFRRDFRTPYIAGMGRNASEVEDEETRLARGYDIVPWLPWLGIDENALAVPERRILAGFSPEQENFGLTSAANLNPDYLQLILGGARSRWTTVRLAEVFSRMVGGCRVEASFFELETAPTCGSSDTLRAPPVLLGALRSVVRSGDGTAHRLSPRIDALSAQLGGDVVEVYAKTGTPTLEARWDTRANRVLNMLIDQRAVVLRSGRLVPSSGTLEQSTPEGARLFQRWGVTSNQIRDHIDVINQSRRDLIMPGGGGLAYVSEDGFSNEGRGGVIVLTLVRRDHQTGQVKRILTIAVNIQSKGTSPINPATDVLYTLLRADGPIAKELGRNNEL